MSRSWYAVRTAPGAQRPDKADPRFDKVERDLRDHGFDCYNPTEARDVIHHRTRKLITKRLPLIPGYAFVCGVTNFMALQNCESVSGIVHIDGTPIVIPETEIIMLRQAELTIYENLAQERQIRAMKRMKMTRKKLAATFPSGAAIVVKTGFLTAQTGRVVEATGRKTVKATLDKLQNLGVIELPVGEIDRVDEIEFAA